MMSWCLKLAEKWPKNTWSSKLFLQIIASKGQNTNACRVFLVLTPKNHITPTEAEWKSLNSVVAWSKVWKRLDSFAGRCTSFTCCSTSEVAQFLSVWRKQQVCSPLLTTLHSVAESSHSCSLCPLNVRLVLCDEAHLQILQPLHDPSFSFFIIFLLMHNETHATLQWAGEVVTLNGGSGAAVGCCWFPTCQQ